MPQPHATTPQTADPAAARVKVLLPLPLAGSYDYRAPDGIELRPGDFVQVPLGRREAIGVVWAEGDADGIDESRLKDVTGRLAAAPLPDAVRRFVDWVAAYTISAPGSVLRMAMSVPSALEPPKPVTAYALAGSEPEIRMTAARKRVLALLADGPPRSAAEIAREAGVSASVVRGLAAAEALEAILLRDAIRTQSGIQPQEGELTASDIYEKADDLAGLIEGLSAAKQKLALEAFRQAHPDTWVDTYLKLINETGLRLVGELIQILIDTGHFEKFKASLAKLISKREASTDLMLWMGKNRSDSFADILGPEVFRAMMAAIENDRFEDRKTSKLGDLILSDQKLITDLIGSADIELIEDLVRALQATNCFDDMDKRSLLGRIVKEFPSIQNLISGDQAKEDNVLVVSWQSLERRKQEYEELVKEKIPANSREIAIARSYGDLRENHEFKAAKEAQKLLLSRKGELEIDLTRARATDFSDATIDAVTVGNKVGVTNLGSNKPETFILLGAWDGDPDNQILSYLTPLGQAFLGKKPGEEAEFEVDHEAKRYRIESIERYTVAGPSAVADEEDETEAQPAEAND